MSDFHITGGGGWLAFFVVRKALHFCFKWEILPVTKTVLVLVMTPRVTE